MARFKPWQAWSLACLALAANAASYLPFIADDALISLRYAERLLEGRGLTWNDDQVVEGYSNLSWVLLNALLGAAGVDLIVASRVLGFSCAFAVLGAVMYAFRAASQAALVAGLMFAASGSAAAWTIGGLEQPLLAATFAWAVVLCFESDANRSRVWIAALLLGVMCLTRPDAPVLVAALALGHVAATRNVRATIVLVAVPAAFVAAQLVFRLAYYDDWVPNTAHAKLGFSWQRVAEGCGYVVAGLSTMVGVLIPAAVGVATGPRRRVLIVGIPLVSWTAYVMVVGGDIFPAHRHLLIVVVLLAFLAADGARWALERVRTPSGRRRVTFGVGALWALFVVQQIGDDENIRARDERWEWDCKRIAELFRDAFGTREPLLAADPAGCFPYFSKLPAIDPLGLNDRFLAKNRPHTFGTGYLGHELGDGAYVMSRKPDLVVFCGPGGSANACFPSGLQMQRDPAFVSAYQLVTFDADGYRSKVWVRREGRVGIERARDEVVIPGHLFVADDEAPALRGDGGALGIPVTGSAVAGVQLPAGSWFVPNRDGVAIELKGTAVTLLGNGGFAITEPAHIEVHVLATRGPTTVQSVTLRRR